jgi:hypothetical protein
MVRKVCVGGAGNYQYLLVQILLDLWAQGKIFLEQGSSDLLSEKVGQRILSWPASGEEVGESQTDFPASAVFSISFTLKCSVWEVTIFWVPYF